MGSLRGSLVDSNCHSQVGCGWVESFNSNNKGFAQGLSKFRKIYKVKLVGGEGNNIK